MSLNYKIYELRYKSCFSGSMLGQNYYSYISLLIKALIVFIHLLHTNVGEFHVSPRSSPLRDVSRGGRSATQRQKCLLSYAVQGEDNELLLINYDNLKLLIGGEKKSVIFS